MATPQPSASSFPDVNAKTVVWQLGTGEDDKNHVAHEYDNSYDYSEVFPRILEDAKKGRFVNYAKTVDFVHLGKSGSGKTALSGVLIKGESYDGHFGPTAGTKAARVETMESEVDGVNYRIHDTVGLAANNIPEVVADLEKITKENPNYIVNIFLRFDDRYNDSTAEELFGVCDQLASDDPSFWNKVMISITHSDSLPPYIRRLEEDETRKQAIDREIQVWRDYLRQKLKSLLVPQEVFRDMTLVFTSLTGPGYNNEVDPDWVNSFLRAIFDVSIRIFNPGDDSDNVFMAILNNPIFSSRLPSWLSCNVNFPPDTSYEEINTTQEEINTIQEEISTQNITASATGKNDSKNPKLDEGFFIKHQDKLLLAAGGVSSTVGIITFGVAACKYGSLVAAATGPAGIFAGAAVAIGIALVITCCYMKKYRKPKTE